MGAIQSLPLDMAEEINKYDTLSLRNRDVTETLSLQDDLGCNQNPEFDKLELRNRTVTETLSPMAKLGQDAKPNKDAVNGDEYDKLELRNRTVTETLSPVDDLGQDPKDEKANGNNDEEEKEAELELRHFLLWMILDKTQRLLMGVKRRLWQMGRKLKKILSMMNWN